MFEVATLDMARQWHTPTLGTLAELLVFYDKVSIRAPYGRLGDLMLNYPPDDVAFFLKLMAQGRIEVVIDQLPLGEVALELGLITGDAPFFDNTGAIEQLKAAYPIHPEPPFRALDTPDQRRRWFQQWDVLLEKVIRAPDLEDDYFEGLIANAQAKMALITRPEFLSVALQHFGEMASIQMRRTLAEVVPIDIEYGGRLIRGVSDPRGTIGFSAEMLEFLSQADALLDIIDSTVPGDSVTMPSFDRWSSAMVYSSLARAKPLQDIEAFQLSVTGKSTVAAVIDNGAKRFEQVEHLLEAREPYARIVRGKSPEQTLAQAYFEEIGRVSWLSHGPGKAVRFALFTGAGLATGAVLSPLVGAAVGVGLGILDSFVLDNVIKGNACRSFVETKLTPFVSPA